jgi:hypothetical protein
MKARMRHLMTSVQTSLKNNIDIMLLDKNYKPQGKYLRYGKKNTSYQYMGVE